MIFLLISSIFIFGVWFMLKDAPGGYVQKHTPRALRAESWDVA